MGLDQYAFTIPSTPALQELVDKAVTGAPMDHDLRLGFLEELAGIPEDEAAPDAPKVTEIAYWRKHPNLHGWMESLYRKRGGTSVFNCICLPLSLADLDFLEADIKGDHLPETTGFFFGESRPDEKEHDLAFIKAAREALNNGLVVVYDSWW